MDINLTDFINNNNLPKKGTKIVVAMSGGVDSSVTAALLNFAGYQVIGVSMKLYEASMKNNYNRFNQLHEDERKLATAVLNGKDCFFKVSCFHLLC